MNQKEKRKRKKTLRRRFPHTEGCRYFGGADEGIQLVDVCECGAWGKRREALVQWEGV